MPTLLLGFCEPLRLVSLRLTRVLLILVLLGSSACGGSSGSGEASISHSGQFSFSFPLAQVVARIDDFIYVDVRVNDTPAVFILDTGADAFVITKEFADRAGLAESGTTGIVTIAGVSQVPVRKITQFQFGSVSGTDIDAAELELSGFDGIIGVPFFREVLVGIDYQTGILELADRSTLTIESAADASGATVLPSTKFEIDSMFIDGLDVGPVRIDTGSSGGLRVSQMKAQPVLSEKEETRSVVSTATNGKVAGTAFIADELTFGVYSLPQQFVVAQDGGLETGLVGSLVLKQFYLLLDYSSSKVAFRQDRDLRYGLRNQEELGRVRGGFSSLEAGL